MISLSPVRGSYSGKLSVDKKLEKFVPRAGELFFEQPHHLLRDSVCTLCGGVILFLIEL